MRRDLGSDSCWLLDSIQENPTTSHGLVFKRVLRDLIVLAGCKMKLDPDEKQNCMFFGLQLGRNHDKLRKTCTELVRQWIHSKLHDYNPKI